MIGSQPILIIIPLFCTHICIHIFILDVGTPLSSGAKFATCQIKASDFYKGLFGKKMTQKLLDFEGKKHLKLRDLDNRFEHVAKCRRILKFFYFPP
jgi:hypothetical protein